MSIPKEIKEILEYVEEHLSENTKKKSRSYHNSNGQFSSKSAATSVSFQGDKRGRQKMVNGKPQFTKVPCGRNQKSGSKHPFKCKNGEKAWENLEVNPDEMNLVAINSDEIHRKAERELELQNQKDSHHVIKEEEQVQNAINKIKARITVLMKEKRKQRDLKSKNAEVFDRKIDGVDLDIQSLRSKLEVLNNRKKQLKENQDRFDKFVQWSVL